MAKQKNYLENAEKKYFSVVTKAFTLHGKEFKVGQLVSYKEASELTKTLKSLGNISEEETYFDNLEQK